MPAAADHYAHPVARRPQLRVATRNGIVVE
jgi:hypothetical protein